MVQTVFQLFWLTSTLTGLSWAWHLGPLLPLLVIDPSVFLWITAAHSSFLCYGIWDFKPFWFFLFPNCSNASLTISIQLFLHGGLHNVQSLAQIPSLNDPVIMVKRDPSILCTNSEHSLHGSWILCLFHRGYNMLFVIISGDLYIYCFFFLLGFMRK